MQEWVRITNGVLDMDSIIKAKNHDEARKKLHVGYIDRFEVVTVKDAIAAVREVMEKLI